MIKALILSVALILPTPGMAGKPTECNRMGYYASIVAMNRDSGARPEPVAEMLFPYYGEKLAKLIVLRTYFELKSFNPKQVHVDTYWWCMEMLEVNLKQEENKPNKMRM